MFDAEREQQVSPLRGASRSDDPRTAPPRDLQSCKPYSYPKTCTSCTPFSFNPGFRLGFGFPST